MKEYTANKVLSNRALGDDYYLLEIESEGSARMGQFYMLRAWGNVPVLSRPVSVFNADAIDGCLGFVYKIAGQGTAIFAALKRGDALDLLGPLGNGFPETSGKVALVGGGAGIAPLYLAAKQIKAARPENTVDVFLGFSGKPFLVSEYDIAADRLTVNSGGFITDDIDPAQYDVILSCGPEIMMKVLYEKCKNFNHGPHRPHGQKHEISNQKSVSSVRSVIDSTDFQRVPKLYVSLESRMACGVGACFVCSRLVAGVNKKVCKDGPVFPAEEAFGL